MKWDITGFMEYLGVMSVTIPWMDEGINTYFQFRYEAEKYRANSVFGNALPEELKQKSLNDFLGAVYNHWPNSLPKKLSIPLPQPLQTRMTMAPLFIKTAVWMYIENSLGQEKLDSVLKTYFNDWKFKHPYPEDLKTELEKLSGSEALRILLNKKENF